MQEDVYCRLFFCSPVFANIVFLMNRVGAGMNPTQVLLLCGGGGGEHDVSLLSADFLEAELSKIPLVSVIRVEINKEGIWIEKEGRSCQLDLDGTLRMHLISKRIDYVIPCIHGFPGETGDIQSLLDLAGLPYFGCAPSASMICFNKITSKLWFDAIGIPNTPYVFLGECDDDNKRKASDAFDLWGAIFVKAASQGSSVGCYHVTKKEDINTALENAFTFSNQVLIEKALRPRELEIAAYSFKGELIITNPGEVSSPVDTFYSYDEKYSQDSLSATTVEAKNLTDEQRNKLYEYAKAAFIQLKLKDLSRIDFFITENGDVLLNEINTFPGMTPISMFPKLLEHHGHRFCDYLEACIKGK